MADRVPQSTRQILKAIKHLEALQTTLRTRVKGSTPAENLKIRAVSLEVENLAAQLDGITTKLSTRAGSSVDVIKAKLKTESEKRRTGQIGSKTPVQKAVGADKAGCMVALYPSPETAKSIAVEGGEDPSHIHITVVYFEQKAADRDDWDKAASIIKEMASKIPPLHGTLVGTGRFVQPDGEVALAEVSMPGLEELHEGLVETLNSAGFPVSTKHPFHPHATLKYIKHDEPFPDTELKVESLPLDIEDIRFVQGSVVLGTFPFGSAK